MSTPTATLYAPIGLPGCGKEGLAQQLVDAGLFPATAIVSTSKIREMLLDDRDSQAANGLAADLAFQIARGRLSHGRDVWLSATHLTDRARRRVVDEVVTPGTVLVWVRFDTDEAECRARSPHIPGTQLDVMAGQLAAVDWLSLPGHICTAAEMRR